ncbi:MAG: ribonuclease E/G [Lachnospiraceae bacterium]|nr:ribonuclease E/G [Lachnospiraceae bacterium]
MDNTKIITYIKDGVLADALLTDGRLTEISLLPPGKQSLLGNIYVGRVKDIVKNIHAAFVEIEGGVLCYLPLEDVQMPVFTKPKKTDCLAKGDELLVQVSREAQKTKAPSVTTQLSLSGKYLVLNRGKQSVGCSAKLPPPERQRLKELSEGFPLPENLGLIVRTNAEGAAEAELRDEFDKLLAKQKFVPEQAIPRTVFSCLFRERAAYLNSILGNRSGSLKEIITDDEQIFREIQDFLHEEMPEEEGKLRLYRERMQPLKSLYRLEKGISDALSERVWLKSGAYLVIEHTEAMTVIDVNTGKCVTGKDKRETVRKINLEAAAEISRQLRLRNLSGRIVVDFVDMDGDGPHELLSFMRERLRDDPMRATAVDMTQLGLMELTRRKQKKPLREQAKECGML